MSVKLYKLIYDNSVFFTIAAFLLKSFGGITIHNRTYLVLLAILGISVLLSGMRIWKLVAVIVLPVAALLFLLPSLPDVVVFLLAWGYSSYVLISERVVSSHGAFLDMLKHTLSLFALLLVVALAAVLQKTAAALLAACPYLIMTIVSAMALLRYLRLQNQSGKQQGYHQKQQLIELAAFLLVSYTLTLIDAPQNLWNGLRFIYLYLLEPIVAFLASIIGILISGMIYLVIALFRLVTNNKELKPIKIDLGSPIEQAANQYNITASNPHWVIPFLYSVGILLGLLLLYFFFRRIMGVKQEQLLSPDIMETREHLSDHKDKAASYRRRRSKDPRDAVRYYYWKSLLWLQHNKVELKPQDTTEDIYAKYNGLPGENSRGKAEQAEALMKLYQKARYQVQEPVTKEEAAQAKVVVREIAK